MSEISAFDFLGEDQKYIITDDEVIMLVFCNMFLDQKDLDIMKEDLVKLFVKDKQIVDWVVFLPKYYDISIVDWRGLLGSLSGQQYNSLRDAVYQIEQERGSGKENICNI